MLGAGASCEKGTHEDASEADPAVAIGDEKTLAVASEQENTQLGSNRSGREVNPPSLTNVMDSDDDDDDEDDPLRNLAPLSPLVLPEEAVESAGHL